MDPESTEEEYAKELMREELVVTREPKGRGKISPVSPLGGAVLQSNRVLFRRVYDAYKKYGGRWIRQQVLMSSLVFESTAHFCQGFRCFVLARRCPEKCLMLPSFQRRWTTRTYVPYKLQLDVVKGPEAPGGAHSILSQGRPCAVRVSLGAPIL